MRLPPVATIDQRDTTRLINSKYLPDESSVLTRIADDAAHLEDIFALDLLSNDRIRAEHDLLPGVAAEELVHGFAHHSVVNAAFCHAGPFGARFNGPDRGAWYAGFSRETALAEITFYRTLALQEIDHFHDDVTYDAYLADFEGEYHDVRGPGHATVLTPDDHGPAQRLAEELLAAGALGVVYPSVRHEGGTCIACFVPREVRNVRRDVRLRLTWDGDPAPSVTVL